MARRYYNGAVRNLNMLVQSFPSNLIAGLFGFAQREYFELDDAAERAVPAGRAAAGRSARCDRGIVAHRAGRCVALSLLVAGLGGARAFAAEVIQSLRFRRQRRQGRRR